MNMHIKKGALIALALLGLVMVSMSLIPPASATAISNQAAPSVSGLTKLGPGLWVKEIQATLPGGESANNKVVTDNLIFMFNQKIYRVQITTTFNLTASDNTYVYTVILVSDPDESLARVNTFFRITGDEVTVMTSGLFINGTFQSTFNKMFTWYNVTGPIAGWSRLDKTQRDQLQNQIFSTWNSTPTSNLDTRRYLRWGWEFLMTNQTNVHIGTRYAGLTYNVDQAYIPQIARNATNFDISVAVLRHQLMGLVAYNDTNPQNGIMDVRYGSRGNYRGVVSSEAQYVFKTNFAGSVGKHSPTYDSTDGSVDWDMSVFNLNGTLVPVFPGGTNINTTVTELTFAFHFSRSGTTSTMKVDEHIGDFSVKGTAPVQGLSLAIAYFSFFEGLTLSKYTMRLATAAGGTASSASNSTATPRLDIIADNTQIARIQIGDNSYTWGYDGSTQQANSNILPWFFFQDQFQVVGDSSFTTKVAFNASLYFYEACFPKWDGYSIVHDPYFATFSYSTTPGEGGLPIVLIVAGAGIGVVAAAVVLMVRRRKVAENETAKTA